MKVEGPFEHEMSAKEKSIATIWSVVLLAFNQETAYFICYLSGKVARNSASSDQIHGVGSEGDPLVWY